MLKSVQIHLAGPSDLVLSQQLVTAGNDFMMKTVEGENLATQGEVNLAEEAHCLAISQDSIYWGGEGEQLFRVIAEESHPVGKVQGVVRRMVGHADRLLVLADSLQFWEGGAVRHCFDPLEGVVDVALGGEVIFILLKESVQVRASSGELLFQSPLDTPSEARMAFCHESSRLYLPGKRMTVMDTSQQVEQGMDIGVEVIKVFVLAQDLILLQGADRQLTVLFEGRVLKEVAHKDWLNAAAFRKDKQLIYVLDNQGVLSMFSPGLNEHLTLERQPIEEEQPIQEEQPVQEVPEQKPKRALKQEESSYLEELLNFRAQGLFLNGQCQQLQKHRRILCWSLVGLVYLRESETNGQEFINVELADQNRHSNMVMANQFNLSMAELSPGGCLLASSLPDLDLDQYEDDHKQPSVLLFKSFRPGGDWQVTLPEDESAQLLALSLEFAAVGTDLQLLRVYGLNGVCLHVVCIEKPMVSLSAYEHHLACLTLDGAPFFRCQNLKTTLYSVSGLSLSQDLSLPLPLSVGAYLKHLSFSSEGMLVTQDTHGMVRCLVGHNYWTVLLDNGHSQKGNKQFYLVAVHNYQLLGTFLPANDEPAVLPRPALTQLEPKVPMDSFQKVILQQEKFRCAQYSKNSLGRDDSMNRQHRNMMDASQRQEKHSELDRQALHLFRTYLVDNEVERALAVAQHQLFLPASLQVAIQLVQRLELSQLVPPLEDALLRMAPPLEDTTQPPSAHRPKRQFKHGLSLQRLAIQNTQITPITQDDIMSQIKPMDTLPEEPLLSLQTGHAQPMQNPFEAEEQEQSREHNIFQEFQPRKEVIKRVRP